MTTSETGFIARFPHMASPAVRARIARAIIHAVVARVPVRVSYPDGTVVGGGRAGDPELHLNRPDAFYRRLAGHPKIGLGEGYMEGCLLYTSPKPTRPY